MLPTSAGRRRFKGQSFRISLWAPDSQRLCEARGSASSRLGEECQHKKKALFSCALYVLTKTHPTKKEGSELKMYLFPSGRRVFFVVFFLTALSSSRRQQAGSKHPGAFGIRQDVSLPASWRKGTMAV